MPPHEQVDSTLIEIGSLDELRKQQEAIVQRINNAPNGGRLFLADPLRLLNDVHVILSAPARAALEEALGVDALATNPLRNLYDDFQRDKPDEFVTVEIRGILPKEGAGHA